MACIKKLFGWESRSMDLVNLNGFVPPDAKFRPTFKVLDEFAFSNFEIKNDRKPKVQKKRLKHISPTQNVHTKPSEKVTQAHKNNTKISKKSDCKSEPQKNHEKNKKQPLAVCGTQNNINKLKERHISKNGAHKQKPPPVAPRKSILKPVKENFNNYTSPSHNLNNQDHTEVPQTQNISNLTPPLTTHKNNVPQIKLKSKRTKHDSTSTQNSDPGKEQGRQTGKDSGIYIEDPKISESDKPKVSEEKPDDLNPPTTRREIIFFQRPKVSADNGKTVKFQKDEKTRKFIRAAIEANQFLNNYMDSDRKELVIDAMEPKYYAEGSFIIRENEKGSELYVSEEGVFDVLKANEVINTLGPGTVFGELAILYNAKRFASIRASSKAKVWKISRSKFRTIMMISGSKENEENLNFLKTVPHLKDLPVEVQRKVVDLLNRRFFPTGKQIIKQGDAGNDFYIIRGGTVTIMKTNEYNEERVVGHLKRGECFGEQAILNEERRTASVYADAPGTECLMLNRKAFISYLGSIPELKARPVDKVIVPNFDDQGRNLLNLNYDHIQLKDLKTVGTLGVGGFGRVELVSYEKETFALKILKKYEIIRQEQIDHVYSEKSVMAVCKSPFIIELYKTFRDKKYVYFLMEPCLGGDVFSIMRQKTYFDEKLSKFIAGCVVEAFDYLHSRNMIFRDLKPENLMFKPDGYCKLVDFGFAKRMPPNYKTNTFAGTPEYVAPEIILDRGHDRAVDYWTLGILIHELLCGRPPFRGRDQMKIYQQILGGIEAVKWSTRIPKPAQGLIRHLCKQMPAARLGYQRKGIADIKNHSWFEGFDWVKLKNKEMIAPLKRPVNSNKDLRYFTLKYDEDDIPPDELSGWDEDF